MTNKTQRLRTLRVIRNTLLMILLTILLIEAALTLFDPYGLRYLREAEFYDRNYIPHETRNYVLYPGIYDFGNWRATVNEQNERVAPDSVPGCRVVFLGDSLTFGRGVDDADIWVNLLARELGIEAVNTGVDAYNSENVLNTLREYDADLFVWLIVPNDVDPAPHLTAYETMQSDDGVYRYNHLVEIYGHTGSSIATYIRYFRLLKPSDDAQPERFEHDMQEFSRVDNLVMITQDNDFGRDLAQRYPVHLIAPYTHILSIGDPHPNREGHREMADGMLPIVGEAVAEACERE